MNKLILSISILSLALFAGCGDSGKKSPRPRRQEDRTGARQHRKLLQLLRKPH